jgi:DME family drug/metabolite transporter
MNRSFADLRIAASAVLFASVGLAADAAPPGIPAVAWAEVRMLAGGLVLALAIGPRGLAGAARGRSPWRLALAALAMALFQWTFFVAVERAGAVDAALFSTACAPLAARLVERHGAGWLRTAGASALLAAACALSPSGGLAPCLLAGAWYAAYTVLAASDHGLAATCAALLGSGVALMPSSLASPPAALLSATGIAAAAYIAVAGTALAYWLYATGLRQVAPARALSIQLLQPLATMALAAGFAGAAIDARGALVAFLCVASPAALFIPPRGVNP